MPSSAHGSGHDERSVGAAAPMQPSKRLPEAAAGTTQMLCKQLINRTEQQSRARHLAAPHVRCHSKGARCIMARVLPTATPDKHSEMIHADRHARRSPPGHRGRGRLSSEFSLPAPMPSQAAGTAGPGKRGEGACGRTFQLDLDKAMQWFDKPMVSGHRIVEPLVSHETAFRPALPTRGRKQPAEGPYHGLRSTRWLSSPSQR